MEEVVIILVKPQLGENIGMAARAMLNFGVHSLRLVSPRSWPNDAAISSATHAASIVEKAKVFSSIHEAVSDLKFLYGTTARGRDLNKEVISSEALRQDINKIGVTESKVGILFGPENSGLDNEAVSLLNKIVSIPVGTEFSSINLAVAVGIICYELSKTKSIQIKIPTKNINLASQQDMTVLLKFLGTLLDDINFYQTPQKKKKMQQNINCLFKRIDGLTKNEVSTLMGIFQGLFKHKQ